jgi:GT2 family glycosyltransferase
MRYQGVAPFWRGWWMIILVPDEMPEHRFVELQVRGDINKGQVLDLKMPIVGRSNRRLFHAGWRVREVVLKSPPAGGTYSVQNLSLLPVLLQFARRHMYSLLVQGSRDLRGKPLKDLAPAAADGDADGSTGPEGWLYWQYEEALDDLLEGGQKLYDRWIRFVEPQLFTNAARLDIAGPRISVVMPVHNPVEAHLRRAIESVLEQRYRNWELCVADDASDRPFVRAVIAEYQARDDRVKAVFCDNHGHISATTNRALELAGGEFIAFLDHDDELSPHALSEVADALRQQTDLDIVYSDEDFIDPGGNRCSPHFKSDWNPYLLYSHNYVTHLCVYRRTLVTRAGGLRVGVEGAQDYDLLLRCSRLASPSRIRHIPKVLYHWRLSEASTSVNAGRKRYTHAAGAKALQDYFAGSGTPVTVSSAGLDNFYRVDFEASAPPPLVTLIVPTRDQVGLLESCVDGLLNRTGYRCIEILIVDNGSVEAATLRYLEAIENNELVRVLRFDEPFNFARICNFAATHANGELLGFLNNDIDVIDAGWLDEMVMLARRPDVGCVGAKLLYQDGMIQHAGVILGLGGYAAHAHRCFPRDHGGYFGRLKVRQNVSAVTGACLVVRKAVYQQVGGMDEKLTVAYNDVDFCLKVREAGFLNVFTPFATLYHFESKTRGYEDTPEKQARFQREKDYLAKKWGDRLRLDPYYNPNLTHAREDFSIGS